MQRLLLLFSVALFSSVQSLDVEIVGIKCDDSLPVTADVKLKDCAAGSRCTFGQEATVYGSLYYNGVENSGIQENIGYITADLSLWTLDFNLLDMLPINMCDETLVADENNQNPCPGDGTQNYEVIYKLPSAGNEQTSWLASGWDGSGLIQIFAAQDESMKIGECSLSLKTYVSRPEGERSSLLSVPSAAAAVGISVAVAAALALLMFYCYCCCKKRKEKNSKVQDDEASRFQRMEEEKSYWSGAGSRRSKKSASTKKSDEEAASIVSELP